MLGVVGAHLERLSWNGAHVDLNHERLLQDRTCAFTVAVDGSVDYSRTYHDPLADMSQIELITLDGIDHDQADFFRWAAGLRNRTGADGRDVRSTKALRASRSGRSDRSKDTPAVLTVAR